MTELASQSDLDRLRREVMVYRQGVLAESERLHLEAEIGRLLNRYSRRTWIAMAAGITWVVLNLGDAARAYADNVWWDLLFWPSHHQPGSADGPPFHWFQIVGFLWQAVGMYVLWRRSQVPDFLVDRVRAPKSMRASADDVARLRQLHEERHHK